MEMRPVVAIFMLKLVEERKVAQWGFQETSLEYIQVKNMKYMA